MDRNITGTPRPQGYEEILEAIEEVHAGSIPDEDLYAVLYLEEDNHIFYAQVLRNEDGEGFTTGDYTNEEDLRKDLSAAGIPVPGPVTHA